MRITDPIDRLGAQRPPVQLPHEIPDLPPDLTTAPRVTTVKPVRTRSEGRLRWRAPALAAAAATGIVVAVTAIAQTGDGPVQSGSATPTDEPVTVTEGSAAPSVAQSDSMPVPDPAAPASEQLLVLAQNALHAPELQPGEVAYVRTSWKGYTQMHHAPGQGYTIEPFEPGTSEAWGTSDEAELSACFSDVTAENFGARAYWSPDDDRATLGLIRRIAGCGTEYMTAPQAQHLMLTLLSGRSDIVAAGPVTDMVGRSGLGFYVIIPGELVDMPGGESHMTIILDPTSGMLLEVADTVTVDPKNLAPVPYDLWRETVELVAKVSAVGERP